MTQVRKKISLTPKRKKWVSERNKKLLKGKRLSYNASQRAKYEAELINLVNRMTTKTKREIIKLFNTPAAKQFAMDADIASQARILTNKLTKQFNTLFNNKAWSLAERMLRGASRESSSSLGISLKELSGGLTIKTNSIPANLKTIIKATTTENVALIKSIGEEYLSKVQKTVMRSITNGEGLKTLVPELEKYEGISKRHAKNVATDQTRKAYNSMNKARMEKVGVKKFEWVHSGGGQRPREDHIAMSGNIYSFDDPPIIDKKTGERGIPGQAINCGCTMVPVIEFDEDEDNAG